jgi:two-component system nitrogen regulation response regulator GlnG
MVEDASTLMPPPARGSTAERGLTLTIIYHPDVARIGERARITNAEAELARATPVFAGDPGEPRPLADRYVSRAPLQIRRAGDRVTLEAAKASRIAVEGRPLDGPRTFERDALASGIVIELAERVVVLLHLTTQRPRRSRHNLVGDSDAISQLREDIDRVADLDVPVLLRGETGTGKELVARAIHDAGGAPDRPFIAVNIAALLPTTAASELFGHVRGAFTGASNDHEGLFVRAAGGTLFLDEIGETPYDVQPMLLRVLETSEVTPLGGSRSRRVDVRLIAATDADLETQIAESGFRAALFHRLAGYQLLVPALRDRRDDIGRLLLHFLRVELAATGDLGKLERQRNASQLWLPSSLVARLARHSWPGNVRQLRNAARQLAISSRGADEAQVDAILDRLLAAAPPSTFATPVRSAPAQPASEARQRRDPSEISDDELLAAMRANNWRAVGSAAQLGISRSTLYNLIDRSKRIRKAKDIPEAELRRVFDACGGDLDVAAADLELSRRSLKLRITELGWDAD